MADKIIGIIAGIGLVVIALFLIAVSPLMFMVAYGDEETESFNQYEVEVGETKELEFVKHVEGNEYQLGFINEEGELVWQTFEPTGAKLRAKIKYDETAETSTLQKHENDTFLIFVSGVNYTLTIGKDLEGGTIQRDCGKNCTKEINTEVLD